MGKPDRITHRNPRLQPGHAALLFAAAASAGLALTGCLVGPDYQRPNPTVPDAWHQAITNQFLAERPDIATWWTNFHDPTLTRLVEHAGRDNLNLKIAAARVQEAQALRGVARSGLLPQVSGLGSAQATRVSERTTSLPAGADPETGFYQVGATAGWELDLWGRVRRSIESATASWQASVEDYRDALVVLHAEVAETYLEVRTLQERIRLARSNALAQAATLQLTTNLNQAGLVGDLDVSQATLNLRQTESMIPVLESARARATHRLGVLLGLAPAALFEELSEPAPIPEPPAALRVGLPANLLRQRPDLRRAERLLAAQTARIGVAAAELYPQLSLPGTLTLEAFEPGNLDGRSLAYAFGPQLRWTLFAGGRIRSTIKAEEARTQQALHAYEQTLLLALEDAENAIVALARERDRLEKLTAARDAARRSVSLVLDQYRTGLTQFQNVLDMQRSLTAAEDGLATSRGALAADAVRLYRALGGGWSAADLVTLEPPASALLPAAQ